MVSDANSWMSYREVPKREGAVQSAGRHLDKLEQNLADALESIFAQGIHDMQQVAENLSDLGIKAPENGRTNWDVQLLSSELESLNFSLDIAYEKDGYGA